MKNVYVSEKNLPNVMDRYAEECWMAEIKSSFGWIECVLIADRSVSVLNKIGVSVKAREKLAQPKEVESVVIKPINKELGPAFRNDRIKVVEALTTMNEKDAMKMKAALESKGEVEFEVCTLEKTLTIKRNMVSISKETRKVHHRTFKSAVIESSFVMGRIIYCLFEHSFYTRPSTAVCWQTRDICIPFLPSCGTQTMLRLLFGPGSAIKGSLCLPIDCSIELMYQINLGKFLMCS